MKRTYFHARMDAFHFERRMIICLFMSGIALLIPRFPGVYLLHAIYFVGVLSCVHIETLVRFDQHGIYAYSMFRKRVFIPWDSVTHWGMTNEVVSAGKKHEYFYMATMPLIKSPKEKMPAISKNLVYLTYSENIKEELVRFGQKSIAMSLPKNNSFVLSSDMRRRLIWVTILVFMCIPPAMVLFYMMRVPLLILHAVYFAYFVFVYLKYYLM